MMVTIVTGNKITATLNCISKNDDEFGRGFDLSGSSMILGLLRR